MDYDEKPFPLLIVGAGRMGSAWINALAEENKTTTPTRIIGVADPDPARSGATLPLAGIEVMPDPKIAAGKLKPAGVILCTPPNSHAELAVAFMEMGIPVLCEKPLTTTTGEAERMATCARESKTPFFMASKFRFMKDLQRTVELLESKILGQVVTARIEFSGQFPAANSWHANLNISGGGVIADNGPHALDVARMLLGPINQINAAAAPRIQEIQPEDTAHMTLRHESGTLTRVFLSWSLPPTSPWLVQIQGSQGTLQVGWQESRYKMHDAPDQVTFGSGYNKNESLVSMATTFAAAVRGEANYPVDEEAAMAAVRLTAEATAQIKETP